MRAGFIVLVFLVVLIFGCSGNLRSLFFREGNGTSSAEGLEGESEGIVFRFLPDAPPDEVFVGEEFGVEMEVANLGEGRVSDGSKIYLDGVSFSDFIIKSSSGFDSNSKSFDLNRGDFEPSSRIGRRYSVGGSKVYSLGLLYDSFILDEQEFSINARSCYGYESSSNAKVCIGAGRGGSRSFRGRGCDSRREVLASNQVGPIKVSSVVQSGYRNGEIGFKIKVRNFGDGNSYLNFVSSGSGDIDIKDCREVDYEEEGIVFLGGELLVGGEAIELNCNPSVLEFFGINDARIEEEMRNEFGDIWIVKLVDGEGEVSCVADVSGKLSEFGLYEENLLINLGYLYTASESKSFKVKSAD